MGMYMKMLLLLVFKEHYVGTLTGQLRFAA